MGTHNPRNPLNSNPLNLLLNGIQKPSGLGNTFAVRILCSQHFCPTICRGLYFTRKKSRQMGQNAVTRSPAALNETPWVQQHDDDKLLWQRDFLQLLPQH